MTEVESLLSVDAGVIPPGVTAYFMDDPQRTRRVVRRVVALALAGAAGICAYRGMGFPLVGLLVLAAGILGVLSTGTVDENAQVPIKRPVMVVTPTGIIVRDERGLRSWRFDDLVRIVSTCHNHRPHLVLVERAGKAHAIDYLRFERGERARELIGNSFRVRHAVR